MFASSTQYFRSSIVKKHFLGRLQENHCYRHISILDGNSTKNASVSNSDTWVSYMITECTKSRGNRAGPSHLSLHYTISFTVHEGGRHMSAMNASVVLNSHVNIIFFWTYNLHLYTQNCIILFLFFFRFENITRHYKGLHLHKRIC